MALPSELSLLARAYADLRQFSSASYHLREAMDVMEATGEKWFEAEANRLAGEIALMSAKDHAVGQKPHSSER